MTSEMCFEKKGKHSIQVAGTLDVVYCVNEYHILIDSCSVVN